jgi:superfamily II RNA helicase
MIFMSATHPNAVKVASWIARTKQKTVLIERNHIRPVPLQHALYSCGEILPLDKKGEFETSYQSVKSRNSTNSSHTASYWDNVVETLQEKQLLPAIMFAFSIANVGKLSGFVGKRNLLTPEEPPLQRLAPEDRELPQITTVLGLLEHGIGIHHGGLLPLLKEIVEILLVDGSLKLLSCTSTFAMGINVPARTCVFTQLTKFNGKDIALLTPSEFMQMSGRAGRRGIDQVGVSLIVCAEKVPDIEYLRRLVSGTAQRLESHFHIRFNMILNLVRVKGIAMIDLLKRTLSADALQARVPQMREDLESGTK